MLLLADIDRMTREAGEGWGYAHVCRVQRLADRIGVGEVYDAEVLQWAIYLHDWGAFPRYARQGVAHPLRSRQVAEVDILPDSPFTLAQRTTLLEAIEKHDYRDTRPLETREALILREADWLDMLGTIGVIREFAWGPNNLQICRDRVVAHREAVAGRFTLPVARVLAAERIERMNALLAQLAEDSFGLL